ncbi:hypothetical protein [Saccharomonospora saliphila]|uniref:hypothetical protein n=1 Tax=Saccharomonospora saliphila TaxID=369829 RepID=UPI0003A02D42|nr:hypothetical protein [Saccharomonospora saliphila]
MTVSSSATTGSCATAAKTSLRVRFPPDSARHGVVGLAVAQNVLATNELLALTPAADAVTAVGGSFVYTFRVRHDGPVTVTFRLRPDSGPGLRRATVGVPSAEPVRFRQFVYP